MREWRQRERRSGCTTVHSYTLIFRFLICLIGILAAPTAAAMDTRTGVFSPDIRSLKIEVEGSPMAQPVLVMDADDHLIVSFDYLAEERQYLRYSIIHCDAQWQPSQLAESEVFPDGFNYADVRDFEYSRATATHYVHYRIVLPNEDYHFTLSGNYLLMVYPEDSADDTLLQVRFRVTENVVSVSAVIDMQTDIDYRSAHQQLSLEVTADRSVVRDPFNDLIVTVTQNSRDDEARTLLHPSRLQGSTNIYDHQRALIFPAGNEYRRMETVSTQYPGMHVAEIGFQEPYYHHVLQLDEPRAFDEYRYDQTQRGRFFVREYNSSESDIDADYTVVHFTLAQPRLPQGQDVYVEGDLTQRRLNGNSRMRYNDETGAYEKALMLKQGAYNYQYIIADSEGRTPNSLQPSSLKGLNSAAIEGNFYQTQNEYTIAVYYRPQGARYDRLLAFLQLF